MVTKIVSKPPDKIIKYSDTLSLSEFKTGSCQGFWLYDKTRGMNLSIRAKSEINSLLEAIQYYQNRLLKIEQDYTKLKSNINTFFNSIQEELDGN